MSSSQQPRGLGAAARISALAASVMDLHVRIALQEVDREKRRLISGGLFLAIGGTSMLLALLMAEVALVLWIQATKLFALFAAAASISCYWHQLRLGGQVLKDIPASTLEGISRTFRAGR